MNEKRTAQFALLSQRDLMNLSLEDLREARLELPACEQARLLTGEPVAARHGLIQALIELRKVEERCKQAERDEEQAYAAMLLELKRDADAGNLHGAAAPEPTTTDEQKEN